MGVKLNSTDDQVAKVHRRLVNKELGAIKRKDTIEVKNQQKVAQMQNKIQAKLEQDERNFQTERAKRIAELMIRRKASSTEAMDSTNLSGN